MIEKASCTLGIIFCNTSSIAPSLTKKEPGNQNKMLEEAEAAAQTATNINIWLMSIWIKVNKNKYNDIPPKNTTKTSPITQIIPLKKEYFTGTITSFFEIDRFVQSIRCLKLGGSNVRIETTAKITEIQGFTIMSTPGLMR